MSISYDCCSSVAYGTRSKIQNVVTEEIYDFREQPGEAVYSQTYLCSNAPAEWKDPAVLWNEVAKVEKASDARQARTFVGNLPAELADKPEEMQKIVDEVGKGFAEDGMCCTISIHKPDADSDNWHWHANCTMRKVDENGKFEPKSKKIYEYEKDEFGNFILDENGKQIKMLKRDKDGNPKRDKGGHVIYVCHKEYLDNGWSTEKKLKEWRKRYEEIENRALERNGFDVRVSCERYTKQGCILPPLPRLSVKDWNLKKEGGTNEAIEEWKKVEAERQRIREEFPQMFDEKGRQKVSLDVAIAALEEQKAQLEKEIAEEQQHADERVIGEVAPEKEAVSGATAPDVHKETPETAELPATQANKVEYKIYQYAQLTPDPDEDNTYWVMTTFITTTENLSGRVEEYDGKKHMYFDTKEERAAALQELGKKHKLLQENYHADENKLILPEISQLQSIGNEEPRGVSGWLGDMERNAIKIAAGRKLTVEEGRAQGEKDAENWFSRNIESVKNLCDKITDYIDTVFTQQLSIFQKHKRKYNEKQISKIKTIDTEQANRTYENDKNNCKSWLNRLAKAITDRYVKYLDVQYKAAKKAKEAAEKEYVKPEERWELHSTAEHRQAVKEYKIAYAEEIEKKFAKTARDVRYETINSKEQERSSRAADLAVANKPDNFRILTEGKERQAAKEREMKEYYKQKQKQFELEHPTKRSGLHRW